MLISRFLFPKQAKHNLDACVKTMGVVLENHHRAIDDATATAKIFEKFIPLLKDRGIETLKQLNDAGADNIENIRKLRTNHIIILAKNEIGRVNLYRLISESHLKYFSRKPRIPKTLLMKYREGLRVEFYSKPPWLFILFPSLLSGSDNPSGQLFSGSHASHRSGRTGTS